MKLNTIPLVEHKEYDKPSVFLPENLLREARRQRALPDCEVPEICVLDPDGDLATYLQDEKDAKKDSCWACYHSYMVRYKMGALTIGVVPCAVGSSYAVLVAEQLFVSGCKLLISVTSAGIINEPEKALHFALITEALRDEGCSYHYLPPQQPAQIATRWKEQLTGAEPKIWFAAKSWTTDAPYRETTAAINVAKQAGVTCVEMEAAALYAMAEARGRNVVCFAHLTNTMAQQEGDFEKGEHFGSLETLQVIEAVAQNWQD